MEKFIIMANKVAVALCLVSLVVLSFKEPTLSTIRDQIFFGFMTLVGISTDVRARLGEKG